jgi:hypothetical protein
MMGSIAHGKKRRERKTPMGFDNLEIMLGSIAHRLGYGKKGEKEMPNGF